MSKMPECYFYSRPKLCIGVCLLVDPHQPVDDHGSLRPQPSVKEEETNSLNVCARPSMFVLASVPSFGLLIALHIKRKETPINFILLRNFFKHGLEEEKC